MPHGANKASDEDSFIASEDGIDDEYHLYRSLDQSDPTAQSWGNIDEAEIWDDDSIKQFLEKTDQSRHLQLVGGISQLCLDSFRAKPLSVTEYRSQ